ncbi:unnamed protein product [Caretta caretta]
MICYSILGPFFPREAEKKGASDTVVGLIFGCFALSNFLTSLIVGNYLVQIGAKFMFVAGMFVSGCVTILFGLLDRAPDGPVFIGLCFLVRAMDAMGFAAAVTASFSILAKAFPNNIATVMGCLETFTGLGLVLGPPIGGFLYQSFGYEVPFIVLGCVVLILVPLNMYLLPKYAFILPVLKACALDSYIAAVYKRSILLSEDTKIPVSPEDALMLMNKNTDVLEGAIRTAALQGACIIVPPEDGIYSWVFPKETVYSYLEDIPDPQVTGFHVVTLKNIVFATKRGSGMVGEG